MVRFSCQVRGQAARPATPGPSRSAIMTALKNPRLWINSRSTPRRNCRRDGRWLQAQRERSGRIGRPLANHDGFGMGMENCGL
jgi:hypothetical protein